MILRESVPSRAPVRALFGVILLAVIALPSFTDGQPPFPTPDPNVAQSSPTPIVPTLAGDDREQRLRNLEKSLEALIHEVRELRRPQGYAPRVANPPTTGAPVYELVLDGSGMNYYRPVPAKPAQPGNPNIPAVAEAYPPIASAAAAQQLYLLRATYALSNDKADALAVLLKGLNVPVVEIQVKSNTIIVTTTPQAQRIVGEFIGLLHRKTPAVPTDKPATGEEVPSNFEESVRRKVRPADKPAPAKNVPPGSPAPGATPAPTDSVPVEKPAPAGATPSGPGFSFITGFTR